MSNVNSKQHLLLDWDNTDRDKESPQSKFYNNVGDLSIWSFWYHNSDTKRNPWVMLCSHCSINTNSAIYTTPFTLQLCCKPLDILKRVTKSQKAHISNHDGLEKLHNINFVWHRSQGFPKREQNSRNSSFTESSFLGTIDLLFFKHFYRSIILWLPFIHHINICWETWFFIIELMEEVNQPQNWLTNIISSYTYG